MNSLIDSDSDDDVDDRHRRNSYRGSQDREITLGTTMVLAIFFALAVFGAVFFGFGYSMGAKHAAANTGMVVGVNGGSSFSNFKPSPGSPIGSPAGSPAGATAGLTAGKTVAPDAAFLTPTPAPPAKATGKPAALPDATAEDTPVAAAVQTAPRPGKPAAAAVATPSAQIAGEYMVQVAASSHEEDAETVVSALKRRGYNVAIHTEPQDKFFHVQIGPFNNRADALAMSKKVAADGFNAIVK